MSYSWFSTRIFYKCSERTDIFSHYYQQIDSEKNNQQNCKSTNPGLQTWTTRSCRCGNVWFTLYHALCPCAVLLLVGDEGHLQELGGGAYIRAVLLAIWFCFLAALFLNHHPISCLCRTLGFFVVNVELWAGKLKLGTGGISFVSYAAFDISPIFLFSLCFEGVRVPTANSYCFWKLTLFLASDIISSRTEYMYH